MSNNQNQGGVSPSAGYAGGMPTGATTGPRYNPPPRFVIGPSPGGGGGQGYYTGSGLVDENNTVALPGPYIIDNTEVRRIYGEMSPEYRARVMDTLRRKGFYTGSSNFENDLDAIASWLDFSNTIGVTRSRALLEMDRSIPDRQSTGGGPRYRVSNPADIRVAVKRAFMDTLGRGPTEQELAMVVPGFQQAQIQGQMGAVAAPDVTTFAEGAAQFMAPTEANGYKFLNSVNRLFNAIGGV